MPNSDFKIKRRSENGVLKSLALSLIIGLLTFIGIITAASLMILKISVPCEYLYIFVLIASGLSALTGSVSSCFFVTGKRLIFGMGISIVLAITEFILILCFNNISLSNNVYFLFPIAIFFGFIGCVIGTNIKKK